MTLDEFLPYVLPKAKQCPQPTAIQAIRLALIELCEESLVWEETQPSILTVLDQTGYAYTPAAGQRIVKLLSLKLAGEDVRVLTPSNGKGLNDAGSICVYAYGTMSGFELRPAQAAGLSVITHAAVAPSLAATTVPNAFERYVEGVAWGALYRLHSSKDQAYTDVERAKQAKIEWLGCIAEAKSDAQTGGTRANPRTQAHWF